MKVRDLVISHSASVGTSLIVKSIRTRYKYVDNKRTTDQDGFSIDCVLPERGYIDLTVSVPKIPAELEQLNGNNPVVQFENITLFTYGPQTDSKVGAKADSVHIIGGGQTKA